MLCIIRSIPSKQSLVQHNLNDLNGVINFEMPFLMHFSRMIDNVLLIPGSGRVLQSSSSGARDDPQTSEYVDILFKT